MGAFRAGRLPRPVLRFREGTSTSPYRGLSLGFKPLSGPKALALGVLAEERVAGRMEELAARVIEGYGRFRGLAEVFDVYVEVDRVTVGSLEEAGEALESLRGVDVVLAAVPDEVAVPDLEDYYVPIKQAAAGLGIPSQMVNYSTLHRLSGSEHVLFNLALNIYGKAGGVAWGLAEPLGADAYVGVDVAGGFLAVTLFLRPEEPLVDWSYALNPSVEVAVAMRDGVLDAISRAAEVVGELGRVVIHRDGRAHWSEVEAVREAVRMARDAGLVADRPFYALLEVRKRVLPRIFKAAGSKALNPDKGVYVMMDPYTVLVATAGFPERRLVSSTGLVRPIAVRLVDASDWEVPVKDLARDVYWLSQLHWGSAFVSPRLPITTLYSHKISRLLSMGVHPPEEYRGRLWFL